MQMHGIPRKKTGQERSCDFVFLSRVINATPTGESWVKFQLRNDEPPELHPDDLLLRDPQATTLHQTIKRAKD